MLGIHVDAGCFDDILWSTNFADILWSTKLMLHAYFVRDAVPTYSFQ